MNPSAARCVSASATSGYSEAMRCSSSVHVQTPMSSLEGHCGLLPAPPAAPAAAAAVPAFRFDSRPLRAPRPLSHFLLPPQFFACWKKLRNVAALGGPPGPTPPPPPAPLASKFAAWQVGSTAAADATAAAAAAAATQAADGDTTCRHDHTRRQVADNMAQRGSVRVTNTHNSMSCDEVRQGPSPQTQRSSVKPATLSLYSMKIFLDWVSQPSRAIVAFCRLSGVSAELEVVRIARGEHRKALKGKVPVLKVPVIIDDDGFTLFESHTIMRYLATTRKVADQWYPAHPKTRAQVDRVLDWHHTNLRQGSAGMVFLALLAPMRGIEVSDAQRKMNAAILKASLKTMEKWLTEGDWIAGTDKPSIADLSLGCEATQLPLVGYSIADNGFPNVAAWVERLRAIPEFQEVHKAVDKLAARLNNSKL